MKESVLLAVDLGVKTGFAVFTNRPGILSYGSRNYGNAGRLKRGAKGILHEIPGLTHLVIEGGGPLAKAWSEEAARMGIEILTTSADEWRESIFWQRDRRTGIQAKHNAIVTAKLVIEHLGGPRPSTLLQDDTAEAILTGWWALGQLGWYSPLPRL